MMLRVDDLIVAYGNITALHGISFNVEEGEIVTLIGANGAGKSTILWTIARQIGELGGKVLSGSVTYKGADLLKWAAHEVVNRLGISLVPEGRRIFGNLTVLENLRLAAYVRQDSKGVGEDFERVFTTFPRLGERKHQLADLLSGGEQQMLAVGRALMNRSRLMLLDEPSMGLSPLLVREVFRTLVEINKEGITILLVEQNAHMALKYAARGYVLQTGSILFSGKASDIAKNPEVKKAYLGG
jgi:branched-chain amino acid transport system ATP-binding protein